MKFQNKTILIISPEKFDAQFVSKHHYAITLASQNNSVYFLNPPSNINHIKETEYSNLYEIESRNIQKGLRFFPKFLRIYLQHQWLKKIEKSISKRFDIVWLFENSRFYDMDFAPNCYKIYHQVDLNQNFHIKEASISADICFCTSEAIGKNIVNYNLNTYKINHGLKVSSKSDAKASYPIKYSNKQIEVAYVGNLDIKYLDVDILIHLIQSHKEINFHLIGKVTHSKKLYQKCKEYSNVKFYGKVPSQNIIGILFSMDILLLLYQYTNDYEKAQLSNPHKLMEYLYCAKVVMATYTQEYKDKRDLIEMVDNNSEYLAKFREIVANLDYYNESKRQDKRRKFALDNSYEKQLWRIEKLIEESNK